MEKAKEINIALEEQIPLILANNELGSVEDIGRKRNLGESEDLHNLLKSEEKILNALNQRKNLIDYKLRHYGGDNLTGIEGIDRLNTQLRPRDSMIKSSLKRNANLLIN